MRHTTPRRITAQPSGFAQEITTRRYPLGRREGQGGPRPRLGEWLVSQGLINRAQLFEGLSVHLRHKTRLGDALVWLQHVDRPSLERAARDLIPPSSPKSPPPLPRSSDEDPSRSPSNPLEDPRDLDTTRRLRRRP